jgi:flagellar protein FliS
MTTSPQMTARRYQDAQFATADRGRLLLLMFEGAHRFLVEAERGLAEVDLARFAAGLARAQAVIAELLHTLDFARGGEIAPRLEALYRFMLDHLLEASARRSARHVVEVRRILDVIAGAYREVAGRGAVGADAA